MADLAFARERMVARQIAGRGVCDRRVLNAMREVPREAFVPDRYRDYAYDDTPIPIGCGQTISQPYIVALMIVEAALAPGDHVLEIGAGSGYAAAVMSRIAAHVHAIERLPELVEVATARLAQLGYANVDVRLGDGTRGWPAAAPFDAIIASAGGPAIPHVLKDQLAIDGRLIMPVGQTSRRQVLTLVRRVSTTQFEEDHLGNVAFVPLIGEYGWAAS